MFDPEAEWEDTDCNGSQERSKGKPADDWAVNIYPNPANMYLLIDITDFDGKGAYHFEMYNTLGIPVLNVSKIMAGKSHINTVSFPPGVYYYRLIGTDKSDSIRSGKLTITH